MTRLRTMLLAASLLCVSLVAPAVQASTAASVGAAPASPAGATTSRPVTKKADADGKVSRRPSTKAGAPDVQTYASREAQAQKLERFEGGGTSIYLSSGAAAVILIIIVLLIVF